MRAAAPAGGRPVLFPKSLSTELGARTSMMTNVHGNMYGDESLFASVARDVTAMVSRVNDIRKWLSAFPDVDRLTTKLKCPASIVNVARKLPSDIARFLTAGANNVAAWASFSSAMAGLQRLSEF